MSLTNDARAVQAAIHKALGEDPGVTALLGDPIRAYDDVPPEPIYPYLTYGRIRSEDASGDAAPRSTHQLSVHLWSRETSRSETLNGLGHVERALTTPLTTPLSDGGGLRAVSLYTDIFRAPDGRTRHGLLRLSVILET